MKRPYLCKSLYEEGERVFYVQPGKQPEPCVVERRYREGSRHKRGTIRYTVKFQGGATVSGLRASDLRYKEVQL